MHCEMREMVSRLYFFFLFFNNLVWQHSHQTITELGVKSYIEWNTINLTLRIVWFYWFIKRFLLLMYLRAVSKNIYCPPLQRSLLQQLYSQSSLSLQNSLHTDSSLHVLRWYLLFPLGFSSIVTHLHPGSQ